VRDFDIRILWCKSHHCDKLRRTLECAYPLSRRFRWEQITNKGDLRSIKAASMDLKLAVLFRNIFPVLRWVTYTV
jgi:hypothetical protein